MRLDSLGASTKQQKPPFLLSGNVCVASPTSLAPDLRRLVVCVRSGLKECPWKGGLAFLALDLKSPA